MVIRPFTAEQKSENNWTGPGSSVASVSASGNGGHGFDPGPRHIKVVKNGTRSLGTQTYGVEL